MCFEFVIQRLSVLFSKNLKFDSRNSLFEINHAFRFVLHKPHASSKQHVVYAITFEFGCPLLGHIEHLESTITTTREFGKIYVKSTST